MTATIKNNTIAKVESGTAMDTLSRASMITMAVSSGMIGLWAIGCLVSAFVSNGAGNVASGLLTALTGM